MAIFTPDERLPSSATLWTITSCNDPKSVFAFFFFVQHFVCKERRHSSCPNHCLIGRLEKREDVNDEMMSDRMGNLLLCV